MHVGAVDETRTRDLHLGKVALYQLSYYRAEAGAGDGNRTHVDSLEGWNSTIELHPHISNGEWSGRRDSDSRPPPWQGGALPTELLPRNVDQQIGADEETRTLTP